MVFCISCIGITCYWNFKIWYQKHEIFYLKKWNFLLKKGNFLLRTWNFLLKTWNFLSKTLNFLFIKYVKTHLSSCLYHNFPIICIGKMLSLMENKSRWNRSLLIPFIFTFHISNNWENEIFIFAILRMNDHDFVLLDHWLYSKSNLSNN